MQSQKSDLETIETLPTSPTMPPRRRWRRWLAAIGALLVVGLMIASSVVVFSLVGKSRGDQGKGQTPIGQWKAVQQGYLFLSIKVAASNPTVLYACATISAVVSNQGTTGVVTILRSADGGDSWQNIGAKMLQGSGCELAVNPANSEDVYVFGGGKSSLSPAILYHSIDGGKTWQTIQPKVFTTSTHTTQRLFLQHLTFVGNSLLAIDWSITPTPIVISPLPQASLSLPRLVRSVDGAQSWTIVDSQFNTLRLGAQSFAVDPTRPTTIYELLGHSILPIERATPGDVVPIFGINQQLYKTTNGGISWSLALDKVPYDSQVQLAADNPAILYVGGVLGPMPLIPQVPQGAPNTGSTPPQYVGGFHLQISRDGGASWKTLPTPPDEGAILNWFVGTDGHVIASPTTPFVERGESGTPVSVPPVLPQGSSGHPPFDSTPAAITANSSIAYSSADASPQQSKSAILSYDPASNSWSTVTAPPEDGTMLAVTPASAHSETALWFMGVGTQGNSYTLYRYVL